MNIKLSHSASTRYSDCGKSYFFHYIEKLRPEVQSSALLFGTAIDKSAEHYSLTKNFDETIELFNKTWQSQVINGKEEDLRFLLNFTYSDKDLDTDLLRVEDWKLLAEHTGNSVEEALKEAIYFKNEVGYARMREEDQLIFNYANWLCLKRKGRLMLKEFKRVFDENVEEVLGTQVKVDLENENGDSVVGFIDFIFKWKGIAKPVIFDLKTAGREYEDDAVKKSPQLSLYVYAVSEKFDNTRTCGYLVLNKNIQKNKKKKCSVCGNDGSGGRFKTCDAITGKDAKGKDIRCGGDWIETVYPKAKSQLLIEEVSEVLVEHVVENFNEINKAIKAEVFPRNFSNCIKYGSIKCNFYNLCHGNSDSGLIKKVDE
jgi:PD-(D/E)XK nuclease superfamily